MEGIKILDISKDARKIVDEIDKLKFMGLDKNTCERIELFMFAMAIGRDANLVKDLTSRDTFVRCEYVPVKYKAIMDSVFISDLNCDNYDAIVDSDAVFSKAENYANAGFWLIKDMMKSSSYASALKFIKELDEKYEEIFGENIEK